jgi:hypothetical protein
MNSLDLVRSGIEDHAKIRAQGGGRRNDCDGNAAISPNSMEVASASSLRSRFT